jgi:hypothetical protein
MNHNSDKSIIQFIKNQSSSLKRLEIHGNIFLNDIVRELPNLESLCLYPPFEENVDFDGQNLMPNNNLKTLILINSAIDSRSLEKLLMHYKHIQKLYIDVLNDIDFINLELSNLSHITVSSFCISLLWKLKMQNLKSLTVIGDDLLLDIVEQIPVENLQHVDKLKVQNENGEDILDFIGHFPALEHLYLISECIILSELEFEDIFAFASLKSMHLMESQWKIDQKPLDFLSDIPYPNSIIKMYSTVFNMINNDEKEIQSCCFSRNLYNSEDDFLSDFDQLNFSTGSSDFDDLEMYGM